MYQCVEKPEEHSKNPKIPSETKETEISKIEDAHFTFTISKDISFPYS